LEIGGYIAVLVTFKNIFSVVVWSLIPHIDYIRCAGRSSDNT